MGIATGLTATLRALPPIPGPMLHPARIAAAVVSQGFKRTGSMMPTGAGLLTACKG